MRQRHNTPFESDGLPFRYAPGKVTAQAELGLMRVLTFVLFAFALMGCTQGNFRACERAEFWRAEIARDIPLGTTKEKAIQWGKDHNVKFDFLEKQRWLYANVEQVSDSGIGFPCSDWNITLKVSLDANDRATGSEVSTVGSCL